ncbi:MAG: alpha/beta hydrolase [Acidimicrobiia bacterium]
MAAAWLFIFGFITLFLVVNALRPPSPPGSRFPALWLPAIITGELAPTWSGVSGLVTLALVSADGLRLAMGRLGLAAVALSWLGLVALIARNLAARRAVEAALANHLSPGERPRWPIWQWVTGWPYRVPSQLERIDDLPLGPGSHTADVYRRRGATGPAPAMLFVHGGGWSGGNKRQGSRPMLHHLATAGWVVASCSYPLSPAATFPEHLVGVKRALAWLREAGPKYGVDPTQVVIAGGSSGAHLAALAALTANRPEYQPGFEDADTSVQACVAVYGIFDFLNRNHTRDPWPLIPRSVMKAYPNHAQAAYRAASPIDQVHPGAPPFLVVHGTHDSVVPPGEARFFVEALRSASANPVTHLEVPGANHAFDVLHSARSREVAHGVLRFIHHTARPADITEEESS